MANIYKECKKQNKTKPEESLRQLGGKRMKKIF